MEKTLKNYRDRLRIIIILYTFCEALDKSDCVHFGLFRNEIRIQALDFLLRYPDFLSMELMSLMEEDKNIERSEIKQIIRDIYATNEPEIRVEEMEKFFHGAYESIDEVIAFHVSVGFIVHESKKRINGLDYDKKYFITKKCAERIEDQLIHIQAVKWYLERCKLLKKYFSRFPGTELKSRQYRYSEYSGVSYKTYIQSINSRVKATFQKHFNEVLP